MTRIPSDRANDRVTTWCQWGMRWFWLAVVPVALAARAPLSGPLQVVLAGYALLQVLISAGLLRGVAIAERPALSQLVDALAGGAIVLAGGGQTLSWIGLLVAAASAGCAAGAAGAVRTGGVVMILAGIVIGWLRGSLPSGLTGAGLHGLLLIPAGALMGALASRWVTAALAALAGFQGVFENALGPSPKLPMEDVESTSDVLRIVRARATQVLEATGVDSEGLECLMLRKVGSRWIGVEDGAEGESHVHIESGPNGLLATAVASGDVESTRTPEADAGLEFVPDAEGWASAACLPLGAGEDCVGLLVLGHADQRAFSAARRRLLEAVGQEARLAVRYARLYRSLQAERDRMNEIQEEARKKLARDLHDGPTQTIAAIAMRLNFARRELERDMQTARQELHKVEEMARQTTKEIRHMLFTLRPLILESRGLDEALYQFAQKVHDTHGQQVWVEVGPEVARSLTGEQQAMLFYIAEEAVTNAQKHAAAENVWVRLLEDGGAVSLEVEDDGVGFNVGAVDAHYEQRGSLGMVTMRERAELLGAEFRLDSDEGSGTCIRVFLPVGADEVESERVEAPETP